MIYLALIAVVEAVVLQARYRSAVVGGPFDGEQRVYDGHECGVVLRSDAIGAIKPRYCVYLPNGRCDVEFHAYAPSLDAGLAMLPKENRR